MRGATASRRWNGSSRAFQSTRPVRGATAWDADQRKGTTYFNPRAPCGARLPCDILAETAAIFQSTRPVRGATAAPAPLRLLGAFQSTRPVRGATYLLRSTRRKMWISIHAPRAGRDDTGQPQRLPGYISIHAPRAGRDLASGHSFCPVTLFQSTRPVRGATRWSQAS